MKLKMMPFSLHIKYTRYLPVLKLGNIFLIQTWEFQPLYAPCARPSRVQWKFLRAQYLVPQNGLPIFNPNWTLRKIQENSDDGLDKKVENQWLVVFAKRYGERSLKQSDEIEKVLRNLFGSSTVKTFDGKMTIFQGQGRLFSVFLYQFNQNLCFFVQQRNCLTRQRFMLLVMEQQ